MMKETRHLVIRLVLVSVGCAMAACSDDSSVPIGREAGLLDIGRSAADRSLADRARVDGERPREARTPDRPAPDRTQQPDLGPKLVLKGPCDPKCPPFCDAIGSKSEGFYTCDKILIGWLLCGKCTPPACQLAGTSAEGWYTSCP